MLKTITVLKIQFKHWFWYIVVSRMLRCDIKKRNLALQNRQINNWNELWYKVLKMSLKWVCHYYYYYNFIFLMLYIIWNKSSFLGKNLIKISFSTDYQNLIYQNTSLKNINLQIRLAYINNSVQIKTKTDTKSERKKNTLKKVAKTQLICYLVYLQWGCIKESRIVYILLLHSLVDANDAMALIWRFAFCRCQRKNNHIEWLVNWC